MMKELLTIYVNIIDLDEICEQIVMDERSFEEELLTGLGRTAKNKNLLHQKILKKLEQLCSKLVNLYAEKKLIAEVMEDFPDEFACQITTELMADPVMLPKSKAIVDRKNIKQSILVNGEKDPFNRQPLKLEELVELPKLKAKIDNWKKEKLQGKHVEEKEINFEGDGEMMEEEDETIFDMDDDNQFENKPGKIFGGGF